MMKRRFQRRIGLVFLTFGLFSASGNLFGDDPEKLIQRLEKASSMEVRQEILKDLTKLLSDPKDTVRYEAAKALEAVGPAAKKISESGLAAALDDESHEVQSAAIRALTAIESDDPKIIRKIIGLLKSKDDENPNDEVAFQASNFLKTRKISAKDYLDDFIAALASDRHGTRVIEHIVPVGEPAVAALIAGFDAPGESTRWNCIDALASIGEKSIPHLRTALPSSSGRIRAGCIDALIELVPGDKIIENTKSMITKSLEDESAEVRAAALGAMGRIGASEEKIADIALKAFQDPEAMVRQRALFLVGGLERKKDHLPQIEKLTSDPSNLVRLQAHSTLMSIDPARTDDAIAYFVRCLTSKDRKELQSAVMELESLGEQSKPAEAALRKLSQDESVDPITRTMAKAAVMVINGKDPYAEPEK